MRPAESISHTPNREASDAVEFNGADGHARARVHVLLEHQLVIHLVNVVAGKDQDVLAGLAADGVEVLIDGVGGSLVPVVAHALHGRQHGYEFPQFVREDAPPFANVPVQGKRLVLG